MILIREHNKLGRNPHHLGGIERCHTLRIRDSVVLFSMYAENWLVPFLDVFKR